MSQFVPSPLLFDFQLTIPRCPTPTARKSGKLVSLKNDASLFLPSTLESGPGFAALKAGWNPDGFAVSATITGKSQPVSGSSRDLAASDHVLIWLDTRPTGNVHRATEYCHHFAVVPSDDDTSGEPTIQTLPIAQQRQSRLESNPKLMKTRVHPKRDGYELEVWVPGSQLYGFREIADIGRIGFYCVVHDTELGVQHLSVDDSFPYSYDPSLWIQLQLEP